MQSCLALVIHNDLPSLFVKKLGMPKRFWRKNRMSVIADFFVIQYMLGWLTHLDRRRYARKLVLGIRCGPNRVVNYGSFGHEGRHK